MRRLHVESNRYSFEAPVRSRNVADVSLGLGDWFLSFPAERQGALRKCE